MGGLLITGGAGFIGSSLAKMAIQSDWKVKIFDNLETSTESIANQLSDLGAEIIIGDIRNQKLFEESIQDCDVVIHLAAKISVQESFVNPDETYDVNVNGTKSVIEVCLANKITKFLFASSAAVYGDSLELPLKEESGGNVLSPYAESKWINEHQVSEARLNGLNATALRFFNVYGPGQKISGAYSAVIPTLINKMLKGERPIIYGNGFQTRDFIHVQDLCSAILSLLQKGNPLFKESVYNVASETETSLLNLVECINQCLKKSASDYEELLPIHLDPRKGDVIQSKASIFRLERDIGWKPKITLSQGVEGLIKDQLSLLE